jgi:hypothetical protein
VALEQDESTAPLATVEAQAVPGEMQALPTEANPPQPAPPQDSQ